MGYFLSKKKGFLSHKIQSDLKVMMKSNQKMENVPSQDLIQSTWKWTGVSFSRWPWLRAVKTREVLLMNLYLFHFHSEKHGGTEWLFPSHHAHISVATKIVFPTALYCWVEGALLLHLPSKMGCFAFFFFLLVENCR